MEKIAVVNKQNEILEYEEKMYVHEKGMLHRAFSVIIYDEMENMLIQQRSAKKYHSPSLWTNACCSHQLEKDGSIINAANRRLYEELHLENIDLNVVGKIEYRCDFENGLIENEIDTLMLGKYSGDIEFNPDEIDDVKWISRDKLNEWRAKSPEEFTYWFKILLMEI